MVFSDMIYESYMKIYDGIRNYSDYVECQKEKTLEAMLSLYCIMFSFSQLDASFKITPIILDRLKKRVLLDYEKALRNEDFCS